MSLVLSQTMQLRSYLSLFLLLFQPLNLSSNYIFFARLLIVWWSINFHWVSSAHGARILRALLATQELHTLAYRQDVTSDRPLWSLWDCFMGAAFCTPIITSQGRVFNGVTV